MYDDAVLITLAGVGFLLVLLAVVTYLANPFSRVTMIRRPFRIDSLNPPQFTDELDKLTVRQGLFWRGFAYLRCGLYILTTRFIHSPRSRAKTTAGIITDIRQRRFRPDRLLLISGDHFVGLFVRNLGVFYYPTLDVRIADTDDGWHDRQVVYLQSVAYALGVFAKHPVPTTTITETGPYLATCINFYAYPSDTVYGMMYALAAALGKETASPHPGGPPRQRLSTQPVAAYLLEKYGPTLQKLYEHYRQTTFDETAGLIRTGLHMSGAKDITRRSSSFYDNVIFWKTTQLAMTLGIIPDDRALLTKLKRQILDTFWLEEEGYFLEDLSAEGVAQRYYSSDWLIVLATGFLDISDETERQYYLRSVHYIRTNKIDQPFPIRYQPDTRAHRQFLAVRLAVASYGGDAIWSFWGMEYIKTLLLLFAASGDQSYLDDADRHIATYEQRMLENGGFPEVYDTHGSLLQTFLYRSIRQTGWVIGFEQVKQMRADIS